MRSKLANILSLLICDDSMRSQSHLDKLSKFCQLSCLQKQWYNLTTQTVCSKSVILTQKTSPIQVVVSDMSSLRRVWGVCDCQNPTGFPSVAWLPVNRNARTVGHTSCLAFSRSFEVMRSSKESVNILGLCPASWIQYNTKYLHAMQKTAFS